MAPLLFCLTILLSSFLLFIVQPLVGRMLLPSLGGTAAVWNTCVVFFQALLLAGYGYTHYVSSRLKPRNQVILHFSLLALVCLLLPIRMFSGLDVPSDSDPTLWLLIQLAMMVGVPFFVISSNAPLLQRWYSLVVTPKSNDDDRDSGNSKRKKNDPYFLYAFSNVGSLCALLAYPFLIEPAFGITSQSGLWLFGFLLLATAFVGCGWLVFSSRVAADVKNQLPAAKAPFTDDADLPKQIWRQRLHWIALAAIPSSLMLGVTTYLATDVGSAPMLWVIPLAIYLLTFILAFARQQLIPHNLLVRISPILILLMAVLLLVDSGSSPWLIAPFHLLTFFVVSMVCHGELNRLRPPVSRLTEFYLLMSVGGFIGGTFNALIAPNLFNDIAEYPLALVAACLIRPRLGTKTNPNPFRLTDLLWPVGIALFGVVAVKLTQLSGWESKTTTMLILFVVPAALCYSFVDRPLRFGLCFAVIVFSCQWMLSDRDVIVAERGFFGVNKVSVDAEHGYRTLINGRTMHGIQRLDDERSTEPLSYYHQSGPIGDIFRGTEREQATRVGVIGLGTGSIASYSRPGQRFDFFEIDPVVCKFASDPQYFQYLSQARGECELILGDARVQLDRRFKNDPRATRSSYDLLILDAFSSDSIPTHLITLEACELYSHFLGDDGILAIHITNKHLDLKPLIAKIAERQGWLACVREDSIAGDHTDNNGKLSSVFVVLTKNGKPHDRLLELAGWKRLTVQREMEPWTDEFSNILDVLAW